MAHRSPLLCYVTDRHSLPDASAGGPIAPLLAKVKDAIAAGADWVQIREKDLSAKELSALLRESLRHARNHAQGGCPVRVMINDRLDLAIAEQADGVHLGEKSLPAKQVKAFLASTPALEGRANFLVGVSCHSLAGAEAAAQSGADYLFFGPVFATPSKAPFGSPQGLERLGEVCRAVPIPVLAIGGINAENAGECIAAGAAGVAAIRLFQDAQDLPAQVEALRASLAKG